MQLSKNQQFLEKEEPRHNQTRRCCIYHMAKTSQKILCVESYIICKGTAKLNLTTLLSSQKTHINIIDRDKEGLYSIHRNSENQQNHYFVFKELHVFGACGVLGWVDSSITDKVLVPRTSKIG